MRSVAKRRAGLTAARRAELKDLHREVVMRRWGIKQRNAASGRLSWFGKCVRCGVMRWLQCAHIMGVGKSPRMQFDADNALPLCYGCHIPWGHTQPFEFVAFVTRLIGPEKVQQLELRRRVKSKVDHGAVYVALVAERTRLRKQQGGAP